MTLQEKYINAGFNIDPQSENMYCVNGMFLLEKLDRHGAYENFKKALTLNNTNTKAKNFVEAYQKKVE